MNQLTVNRENRGKVISPDLYGIFFEDINYSGDGGIYAELVANRSFGFYDRDQRRNLHRMCWETLGNGEISFQTYPVTAYSEKTYDFTEVILQGGVGAGLKNLGYCEEGFCLRAKAGYRLRVIGSAERPVKLTARMTDEKGELLTQERFSFSGGEVRLILTASVDCDRAYLALVMEEAGTIHLRYVSLFPVDTYAGRENGMRADLVERLKALSPKFMRFPGGCIVEGRSLPNMYNWKETVGKPEKRRCNWNRWQHEEYQQEGRHSADYFQSYGIGYFEYFQLCEDIGAKPLPVMNCGMTCQWHEGILVPMDKLNPFIQDILDLIEFANGDISTKWGALRAEMGHAEPFGLSMVGIGNEQWGKAYFERYKAFEEVLQREHPEIRLITCGGWDGEGHDFDEIMEWLERGDCHAYAVDEHFYKSPEWFMKSVHRYDRYDRTLPKVFAGEYAVHTHPHVPNRQNHLQAALTEAAFLTGVEHNADHVVMTCYAPLFARVNHQQWQPDLIWFDSKTSFVTPSYEVQRLFSHHTGQRSILIPEREAWEEKGVYVSASETQDGTVYLKLVNLSQQEQGLTLEGGRWTVTEAKVLSGSLQDCNCIEAPEKVKGCDATVNLPTVVLGAGSLLVLTLQEQRGFD